LAALDALKCRILLPRRDQLQPVKHEKLLENQQFLIFLTVRRTTTQTSRSLIHTYCTINQFFATNDYFDKINIK